MIETMFVADSSPHGEKCVMVGSESYLNNATIEAELFIEQIIKHYGQEPGLSALKVSLNSHDFGTYVSIDYIYNTESDAQIEYGLSVCDDVKDVLEFWDNSIKSKLNRKLVSNV